jgi:iron(III) transport system ATP-binding protein
MTVPLRCDRLTKTFGTTRAVDQVTLDIEPGELFFLLGPSGCGKTTLLRCIAGFYRPDSGSISIGGRDVTEVPAHRRDTGMVFQSYALWPHLTVQQNVAFGLEMRKISRAEIQDRVNRALETVHMIEKMDSRPNELSGGQQQRVALARALVIRPQCLLLDEPLSNLDAKLRLEMRAEIRRICKEAGLTAVYVTHDQKEALSIADRLAILRAGTLQQVGTPRDVYSHPQSRFVASFIGETNFISGTIRERDGGFAVCETLIGPIRGRFASDSVAREGDAVTISVRPETIRFDEPPSERVNVFQGTVHDSVYLGEVAQHEVTVAAQQEITWKAFELNPRIVARDRSEPVRIWIPVEDVVLLTD